MVDVWNCFQQLISHSVLWVKILNVFVGCVCRDWECSFIYLIWPQRISQNGSGGFHTLLNTCYHLFMSQSRSWIAYYTPRLGSNQVICATGCTQSHSRRLSFLTADRWHKRCILYLVQRGVASYTQMAKTYLSIVPVLAAWLGQSSLGV